MKKKKLKRRYERLLDQVIDQRRALSNIQYLLDHGQLVPIHKLLIDIKNTVRAGLER